MVVIIAIIKILEYSAKNKNINDLPLNSTLNPEINSDSPSEKSNGVRFVSASLVIIHIISVILIISLIGDLLVRAVMCSRFICSDMLIDRRIIIIMLISYDTSWETVRIIPRSE